MKRDTRIRRMKVARALVLVQQTIDAEEPTTWQDLQPEERADMLELAQSICILWDALNHPVKE